MTLLTPDGAPDTKPSRPNTHRDRRARTYARLVLLRRVDARLTEVEVDGEVAVYHPGTDKVVLLNAAATEIWRRTPITSLDTVSREVAAHFGIGVEEARAGVQAGVDLLLAEELLVQGEQEPEPVRPGGGRSDGPAGPAGPV